MRTPKSTEILDIYEKSAGFWDNLRQENSFFSKYLITWLCETIPQGSNVLDVGCGTGRPIGEFVLNHGHSLTGVDGAKAMIEIAKSNFADGNWIVQNMVELDLDRKFAAIIAWDSFFHLTNNDQKAALANFSKHLLKNGLLLFNTGHEAGEAYGSVNGHGVYHSSFAPSEYQEILNNFDIEVIEFVPKCRETGNRSYWKCRKSSK